MPGTNAWGDIGGRPPGDREDVQTVAEGTSAPASAAGAAVPPVMDVSAITDQLYIAARPRAKHVAHVRELRIDLVVSMIWFLPTRELTRPPFKIVRLPTIDSPATPIPLWMLRRGVEAAIPVLDVGGRVLVYCRAGRHRSVAMACCILIAQGRTADEAMDLVTDRRPIADPHIFYIERRIRAFERDWIARQRPQTAGPAVDRQ